LTPGIAASVIASEIDKLLLNNERSSDHAPVKVTRARRRDTFVFLFVRHFGLGRAATNGRCFKSLHRRER